MTRATAVHLAVLVALALAASVPMLDGRMIAGHSSLIDVVRLAEVDTVTEAGQPFSAWAPDLYYGHGAPLFRYYGPLSYQAAELFRRAGLSIPSSLKAVYLVALVLSGTGAYVFFSMLFGPAPGLLGGALYLLAPYRLVDIYVRSALAETLALALLPWIAAALVAAAAGGRRGRRMTAAAALLVAAVVMTHNLTALLALPALLLVAPLALPRPLPRGWAGRLAASLLVGALLSGVYWYPVFAGRSEIWLKASVTEGFFDFRKHFVLPTQLLAATTGFGESVEGPADGMPFPAGPAHLAASLLFVGALAAGRAGTTARRAAAGALLAFVPLLMTLPVSRPVWEAVPPLPYLQFPWRFLGLAAFGTSWLGALLVAPGGAAGRRSGAAAVVAAALALAAALPFVSSRYLVYDPSLETPAGISRRNVRTTAYHDYLPIGVRELPAGFPESRFVVGPGGGTVSPLPGGPLRHAASVTSASGAVVECRVFWFPGWGATWNGVPIAIARAAPAGTILAAVPPGTGTLVVAWTGDPLRRTGGLLTLLGLLCGLLLLRGDRGARHAP